ncbi:MULTISPECIES: serine hydrolase domain-containing protein [unclassified Streptomyces]|uniref:serine hydrolase domain-containing protein n=1 Tax=unclassified Streptomyces TaxID=2593676 RepID=UPI003250C29A
MSVRTGLVGVAVVVSVTAGALATPALADAPAKDGHRATQQAMDAAVAAGVPGVTGQATDKYGTWKGTSGLGDLRTNTPRGDRDRYRVGSITKTFVATVLLQLEAEGRMSLDDTVDHWLPGVVTGHGHDGRKITVRQLLNHTSGIYNYTEDKDFQQTVFGRDGFLKHRYDTWAPGKLVSVAMAHKPDFAPGTSWNYSNTNYVLAGMVVKKVTGHSYADEIRRRIIGPLHLRATSLPGTTVTVPRPASRAYSKFPDDPDKKTYDVTELNPTLASSAGEMISDSADLNRFYSALLGGRLLPAAQLAEMKETVPVPTEKGEPEVGYGLALMRQKLSCGKEIWGHSGGIHGSGSDAVTTPDGRHTLSFNFNGDWTGDSQAVMEAEFCPK